MHITKIRLLGFKSFVEPTELLISKGLTGVVGPNGCGKSNLLEALRWVMGETSHKSMRGTSMEDVIFSGTSTRPERSSAEVTIVLDNSERRAPAEHNGADVIEITRRIERDAGSAYRINGRDARARDVKILFEDAATGARSPALVRQGQISELVNAKPEQRRRVLEDAAGIAGLHSRRHEAELRLKAAESNMVRIGDVIGQVQSQMESLKRQARQAKRYKELSEELRRAEALLLHLLWHAAHSEVDAQEALLAGTLARLAEVTERESAALREEGEIAETIQPLREDEAGKGAAVARIRIEQETFEKEAERLVHRQQELEARQGQLQRDLTREESHIGEARELLARLESDRTALIDQEAAAEIAEETAREKLAEAERLLAVKEARLAEATRAAFEHRARMKSLEAAAIDRKAAIERLKRQVVVLEQQARECALKAPDASRLRTLEENGQRLATELVEIERQTTAAEEKVAEAVAVARERRDASQLAQIAASQLRTEVETLTKLLGPVRTDGPAGVIDQLRVAPGYEIALGAALGEDLDAPLATDAPLHWRRMGLGEGDAPLPADVEPLIKHVEGPFELVRRLRQIGVVMRDEGALLQPELRPGQRLVSLEGDLWRWDGYTATANAPTAAALRLAERNRLGDIVEREGSARVAADDLASAERTSAELLRIAEAEERALRQSWKDTQAELAKARDALNQIERQARETEARLAQIADQRERLDASLVEAAERLTEVETALEGMVGDERAEMALATAEQDAQHARQTLNQAKIELAGRERDRRDRVERLRVLEVEQQRWVTRISGARTQIESLEARLRETTSGLNALADLPTVIAEKREALADARAAAERARSIAADQLAAAEQAHRKTSQALREAQAAVAKEREERARIEARLESARARRIEETGRIREHLGIAPEGCLTIAEVEPGAAMPSIADADRTVSRLKSDRERLGGVNLQAEQELAELTEQFTRMEAERADLETAINKYRGAIAQLNGEGRRRLQAAFEVVNGHFQQLFTTLFGGGEARLEMIESAEDPLEGGLEIVAKPPGKKPATLSLLSGGEQTLTALSLIFAVFLTNPSPICVLDEVDAPLDDSNVDRFCALMEKMATDTATRFLVITHHPMTMSRMDRLFGVTMAEKGVSQLVSVDLQMARSLVSEEDAAA